MGLKLRIGKALATEVMFFFRIDLQRVCYWPKADGWK